jgi:hypothetical protein
MAGKLGFLYTLLVTGLFVGTALGHNKCGEWARNYHAASCHWTVAHKPTPTVYQRPVPTLLDNALDCTPSTWVFMTLSYTHTQTQTVRTHLPCPTPSPPPPSNDQLCTAIPNIEDGWIDSIHESNLGANNEATLISILKGPPTQFFALLLGRVDIAFRVGYAFHQSLTVYSWYDSRTDCDYCGVLDVWVATGYPALTDPDRWRFVGRLFSNIGNTPTLALPPGQFFHSVRIVGSSHLFADRQGKGYLLDAIRVQPCVVVPPSFPPAPAFRPTCPFPYWGAQCEHASTLTGIQWHNQFTSKTLCRFIFSFSSTPPTVLALRIPPGFRLDLVNNLLFTDDYAAVRTNEWAWMDSSQEVVYWLTPTEPRYTVQLVESNAALSSKGYCDKYWSAWAGIYRLP